jgi:hypothetical protein
MLNTEYPIVLWNGQPFNPALIQDGGVSLSTALTHIYRREGLEVGSIKLTGSNTTNIEAEIVPTHPEACEDCRLFLSFLEVLGKLQRFLAENGDHAFVEIVFHNGLPFVEPVCNWRKYGIFDDPFEPQIETPTSH